jgi:hypothetical protein
MTPNLTAKYPMPEFNRQNQMRVGVRACGTGRQNIRGAEVRWGRGGGGARFQVSSFRFQVSG